MNPFYTFFLNICSCTHKTNLCAHDKSTQNNIDSTFAACTQKQFSKCRAKQGAFWICRKRAKLLCVMPAVTRFYTISQAKQSANHAYNLQVICAEAGKSCLSDTMHFALHPDYSQ